MKKHILIVEDELLIAKGHCLSLEESGDYECFCVSSGEDALELLNAAQFDCILMDINLGDGMNGVETTSKIRQFGNITPIIFISAYPSPDLNNFVNVFFLEKPLMPGMLVKQVAKSILNFP
jgi:CheY-like chemotaxis protein